MTPKYKPGQTVWVVRHEESRAQNIRRRTFKAEVESIEINPRGIFYLVVDNGRYDGIKYYEDDLFGNRADAIERTNHHLKLIAEQLAEDVKNRWSIDEES